MFTKSLCQWYTWAVPSGQTIEFVAGTLTRPCKSVSAQGKMVISQNIRWSKPTGQTECRQEAPGEGSSFMIPTLTGGSRCLSSEGGTSGLGRMGGCGQHGLFLLLVFGCPACQDGAPTRSLFRTTLMGALQEACYNASLGSFQVCLSVLYSLILARGKHSFLRRLLRVSE